jgi:two-component system, NarL family, response regulator NreC
MSIRLLLAANYTMVREGIRLLLGPARDVRLVGQAECLADAPQKFQELKPDVVLLDVPVEGSSGGLRAVSHIVESSPDARAVVLTSNEDISYARSMLALGARGYVVKHSPSSALIAAVRTTAAGRRFIDPRLSSALAMPHADPKLTGKRPALSQREIEVLGDLARGYTNLQTASHLNLTLRTVETYRARIYRKLHVRNRAELVSYAMVRSLLA